MNTFFNLSEEAIDYINSRFSTYNINGEEAFNKLFSEEVKSMNSENIIEFLRQKDISHIKAQSESPESISNLDNVFLEDSSINRARGALDVTDSEIEIAWNDQYSDSQEIISGDYDFEEMTNKLDFFDNTPIEEITGGSFIFGTLLTARETLKELDNNTIQLNDVPKYFVIKTGKRTVEYALIGVSLASSSPIIVLAGVGYLIHKNKNSLSTIYNKLFIFITDEQTIKTAQIAINKTVTGISTISEQTYSALTSEKTISVVNESKALAIKSTRILATKSYEIATSKKTKEIASETGEIIVNSSIFITNKALDIATHKNTKAIAKEVVDITGNAVNKSIKKGKKLLGEFFK